MKEKLKKLGLLKLGKELSKSHQKKITGGITVHCTEGSYSLTGSCTEHMGYCVAAQHGTFVSCDP